MNPVEEFLEQYGEKQAGFKETLIHAGEGAAASALIGGAFIGGGLAVEKVRDALTKSTDFAEMLEINPDLKEYHRQNPRLFNQMYTSLRSVNPAFAKDPIVAGTYLRRMSENPLSAGGIIADSVRGRPDPRRTSSWDFGADTGAKIVAMDFANRSKSQSRGSV